MESAGVESGAKMLVELDGVDCPSAEPRSPNRHTILRGSHDLSMLRLLMEMALPNILFRNREGNLNKARQECTQDIVARPRSQRVAIAMPSRNQVCIAAILEQAIKCGTEIQQSLVNVTRVMTR